MKRAWSWLKKWGLALFAGLLTIVTFGAYARRRSLQLDAARDAAKVAEAKAKIEHLRGIREQLTERVEEKDEAIEAIDRELAAQKRKLVEAHEAGEGLTDQEVEEAFARLGF